jgi:hypothetical protein
MNDSRPRSPPVRIARSGSSAGSCGMRISSMTKLA